MTTVNVDIPDNLGKLMEETRLFHAGSHPCFMKPELLEPEHKSGAVFLAIAYPVCRFCLASAFLASVETGYCIFNLYFSLRMEKK